MRDVDGVEAGALGTDKQLDVDSLGFRQSEDRELLKEVARKGLLAKVIAGVHAPKQPEGRMPSQCLEVSLLVEGYALPADQRHNLLQHLVGGQVDLVYQNPVSVLESPQEVAFQEHEYQIAVQPIYVLQQALEAQLEFFPLWQSVLSEFWKYDFEGLHQRLQQLFVLSPFQEKADALQVLLVASLGGQPAEVLDVLEQQPLQQHLAVHRLEAAHQVSDVRTQTHVKDVQLFTRDLGQVLDQRCFSAACFADQQEGLVEGDAHQQLFENPQRVLGVDYLLVGEGLLFQLQSHAPQLQPPIGLHVFQLLPLGAVDVLNLLKLFVHHLSEVLCQMALPQVVDDAVFLFLQQLSPAILDAPPQLLQTPISQLLVLLKQFGEELSAGSR